MINNQFSEKILSYLESHEKNINEELLKEAGSRMSFAIRRQTMESHETEPGKLRMSNAGQCVRKLWYGYNNYPQEQLSGRTIATFLTGDLLETSLSVIGRLSGWQLLGKPDGEDEIELNGVKGHADDLLFVPEESKYYVIEYKSMSDFSYDKFVEQGIDDKFGYLTQASLYAKAMATDQFILVAINKNTGHIADRVYDRDENAIAKAYERWETVPNATMAPEREWSPEPETVYNRKTKQRDPTGRSILGVTCAYCNFKNVCYPDLQTDFKSGRPIFVVNEPQSMPI